MKTLSDTLSSDDSRAIIRLLGGVCAHPGNHVAKKRHLMEGLCRIIDADSWGWGLAAQIDPTEPSIHISLLHGRFSEEAYAAFTQAYDHPEMNGVRALLASELDEKRCHLTRLRQQVNSEESCKKSEVYPFWQSAEINGTIISLCPLDRTTFSIVGIYRRLSSGLFTPREKRIAHFLLSEVPKIHAEGWPDDHGITLLALSTREGTVLDLLMQGYSRNKIATSLGISLHTVNDYVKAVFKNFNVHSQAELIVRFQRGDGGDA